MKKYNLSSIMKRAWELVKKAAMTISEGLKKAWAEAKEVKKEFEGYATLQIKDAEYSFNLWENYGKRRIYMGYKGNRAFGYYDLESGKCVGTGVKNYRVERLMDEFKNNFVFA